MKGSIGERESTSTKPQIGEPTWEIETYTGIDPSTGKRKRHFETIRGSEADAQRLLNRLLVELDTGKFAAAPSRMSVAELLRSWLEAYAKIQSSQRTFES